MQVQECTTLRNAIEEALVEDKDGQSARNIEQIEEKLQQQSIMLTNIRKENEQLVLSMRRKEGEIAEIQESAAKVEEKAKKYVKGHKDYVKNYPFIIGNILNAIHNLMYDRNLFTSEQINSLENKMRNISIIN